MTAKYRLTKDALLASGAYGAEDIVEPIPATPEQLALAHDAHYLRTIDGDAFTLQERVRLEIPFTASVRETMTLACGGTLLACRLALELGFAGHLGGGFHHAFAGHGEGFCLLNDVAVALRALRDEGAVERAAVVDLDVHHGNGTASILAGDDGLFTMSMHQEANYPAVKPASDLDVGLEDGTDDETYLAALESALDEVVERNAPELILYLAGADPYHEDQLGGLALTLDGLRRRDRYVIGSASRLGIPIAVVLAGGYAVRLEDTVAIHVATCEELAAAGVGDG